MNLTTYFAFITFALAASAPLLDAQQPSQTKRVGVVTIGSPSTSAPFIAALREGLREHGWIEGQNVIVEPRYAEGKLERLAEIAAELVQLPVFRLSGTLDDRVAQLIQHVAELSDA